MTGRISTITLITAIGIALIFTVIIVWNLNTVFQMHDEANHKALKELYTKQQKALIKSEVNRLTKRIEFLRESAIDNARIGLKDKVTSIANFAENYIRNKPKDINLILDNIINNFKWDENTGYMFILSKEGNILHHGTRPDIIGNNYSAVKESAPTLYNFIKRAYTKGEASGVYRYYKTKDNNKIYDKLSYAKYIPELELMIGASDYIDEIDSKVKRDIVNILRDERFGYKDYGYFWIIDTDYKAVFHIDPNLDGQNLYSQKDINGKYMTRSSIDIAMTFGAGFDDYYWYLPGSDKPSQKISYMKYYPTWNWVIGAGFYYENYLEQVKQEEDISNMVLNSSIRRNIIIMLILFTIIISVSLIIYRRIRKIEDEQESHLNDMKQFENVINSSSIVSITDKDGLITHVNDQFCEITGYSKEMIVGSRHNIISHPDNPKSVYRELWAIIRSGKTWKGIIKNMTSDGKYFYQKSTIVPFKDKSGNIVKYVSISYDVTEVFENKSRLQKQMNIDQLTGLGSRTSLISIVSSSKQSDLAIIDIDDFHKINENYGMTVGDEILKIFAKRLEENPNLTQYDLYRLHSDVFAVFSYTSNMAEFSEKVNQAVTEATRYLFKTDTSEIVLRTITGFAMGSADLLSNADAALQFAKANNISISFYDPEAQKNKNVYESNSQTIIMISDAIEENRVVPFFQKIEGVHDSAQKYESLMRIEDRAGTIVSPAEFLDVSKQTRFYPTLTKIITKKTIDTFKGSNAEFSINISAEDILNPDTMNYIYSYALENHVIKNLTLEIVESESITGSNAATEALYRFKLAGAKIAIDDFGTGYSNFDYLLKIKADYIKIDGSIIKLINKDERARDIVRSIVSYAKKVNMKTVAEFISDANLANEAKMMGIDYLQGYYIGRPEKTVLLDHINVKNKSMFG